MKRISRIEAWVGCVCVCVYWISSSSIMYKREHWYSSSNSYWMFKSSQSILSQHKTILKFTVTQNKREKMHSFITIVIIALTRLGLPWLDLTSTNLHITDIRRSPPFPGIIKSIGWVDIDNHTAPTRHPAINAHQKLMPLPNLLSTREMYCRHSL